MAKPKDIEGLGRHEWRISDPEGVSVAQRLEKQDLMVDWTTLTGPELVERIQRFSATHYDVEVSLDHDREYSDAYSCDYKLEMKGWRTVTNAELEREQLRRRAELRTRELEVERRLEQQREQAERELAAIRRARGE